jgi:copper chaperone NosL
MRIIIGLFSLLILVLSCGDTREDGPSEIYYGEDICERCKMIISEKEFASQYRLSDGKNVKFDDIGCMIHFKDGEKPEHIESIYVMDYDSGEWIDAESGYFVWTENVNTPMGYGILSFNDKKIAQEVAARENGKYLGKLSAASELLKKNSKNKSD